jgi:hypothetical protein
MYMYVQINADKVEILYCMFINYVFLKNAILTSLYYCTLHTALFLTHSLTHLHKTILVVFLFLTVFFTVYFISFISSFDTYYLDVHIYLMQEPYFHI